MYSVDKVKSADVIDEPGALRPTFDVFCYIELGCGEN